MPHLCAVTNHNRHRAMHTHTYIYKWVSSHKVQLYLANTRTLATGEFVPDVSM